MNMKLALTGTGTGSSQNSSHGATSTVTYAVTFHLPLSSNNILDPQTLPAALKALLDKYRPDLKPLEETYRHIHSHPELSGQEEQTAAIAASHLQSLEFEVHTGIGGHGVAGVLCNGTGPTILLRADMDALPLEEKTGLPYASTRKMKDGSGKTTSVMHACGHDTHVTTLMGACSLLHSARAHWSGTLVVVFQPAEEDLDGAKAMVADGLYERVPKPEYVLAQHVMRMRAGCVTVRAGRLLTAADSFDVKIFGRGGHGSMPQVSVDPVLIGASVVVKLQSIVSREVTPGELAVVSVGSIHSGTAGNIIPSECELKISVRTFDPQVRERVHAAIHRIIEAECVAGGAVQKPVITLVSSTPATVNDGVLVERLKGTFGTYFGEKLVEMPAPSASEDFSLLATEVGAPYVMWMFGGIDEKVWDEAVENGTVDELPNNHSPFFAPVIEPTLRTGVDAYAVAALTFLDRKE